ncbi:Bgt-20314, partial [Blumeria graminis f. sp. tritici]
MQSKDETYRDFPKAHVAQLTNLTLISTTNNSSTPISNFIQQFETEQSRLQKLTKSSSDAYRRLFAAFLSHDK